ncbi:MAG: class I SAM-dependent methyltransferase [Polyangiaceae bacterium]
MRWSHGRRFEFARDLVKRLGGRSLFDYGCGDATFAKHVVHDIDRCVVSDLAPCELSHLPEVEFVAIRDLGEAQWHRFDLVFCMEVLEHCVDAAVEQTLDHLHRLVAPGGRVVVSVPIEIGPTLLGKHFMRHFLVRRNIGTYKWTEKHSLGSLTKMVFAGRNTAIERPLYQEGPASWHSHHGFNWRSMRERVATRFVIEKTHFTPLPFTRGFVSSQAWFICRPR